MILTRAGESVDEISNLSAITLDGVKGSWYFVTMNNAANTARKLITGAERDALAPEDLAQLEEAEAVIARIDARHQARIDELAPPRKYNPDRRRSWHDFAPDCGCGEARCNNGIYSYNGSEYRCGGGTNR